MSNKNDAQPGKHNNSSSPPLTLEHIEECAKQIRHVAPVPTHGGGTPWSALAQSEWRVSTVVLACDLSLGEEPPLLPRFSHNYDAATCQYRIAWSESPLEPPNMLHQRAVGALADAVAGIIYGQYLLIFGNAIHESEITIPEIRKLMPKLRIATPPGPVTSAVSTVWMDDVIDARDFTHSFYLAEFLTPRYEEAAQRLTFEVSRASKERLRQKAFQAAGLSYERWRHQHPRRPSGECQLAANAGDSATVSSTTCMLEMDTVASTGDSAWLDAGLAHRKLELLEAAESQQAMRQLAQRSRAVSRACDAIHCRNVGAFADLGERLRTSADRSATDPLCYDLRIAIDRIVVNITDYFEFVPELLAGQASELLVVRAEDAELLEKIFAKMRFEVQRAPMELDIKLGPDVVRCQRQSIKFPGTRKQLSAWAQRLERSGADTWEFEYRVSAEHVEWPRKRVPAPTLVSQVPREELPYALRRTILALMDVEDDFLQVGVGRQLADEAEREQLTMYGPDLSGSEFELTAEELRAFEAKRAGSSNGRA